MQRIRAIDLRSALKIGALVGALLAAVGGGLGVVLSVMFPALPYLAFAGLTNLQNAGAWFWSDGILLVLFGWLLGIPASAVAGSFGLAAVAIAYNVAARLTGGLIVRVEPPPG